MRILMLNHNVKGRGTYFRAYHFGRHLVKKGHQITLLTISPHSRCRFREEVDNGVRLVETPDLLWGKARSGWDLWDTLNRILYIDRHSFDLVHAFDSRPAVILPALSYRKRRGGKLVLDWADWWGRGGTSYSRPYGLANHVIAPIETLFEEGFRNKADGATVICSGLHQRLLSMGFPSKNVLRVPQGSNTDLIRPLDKWEARAELGFPANIALVGVLGGVFPGDAQLLGQALEIVRNESPNCRLIAMGNHVYVSAFNSHGDSVIETGYLSYEKMSKYLACCDVLLLPLRNTVANNGRWPAKLNDYLSAGRPVVTCEVGDMTELFTKHKVGLLSKDTPQDFAEKVLILLGNQEMQEELGSNARKLAEGQLAWEFLTERLDNFYARIRETTI